MDGEPVRESATSASVNFAGRGKAPPLMGDFFQTHIAEPMMAFVS